MLNREFISSGQPVHLHGLVICNFNYAYKIPYNGLFVSSISPVWELSVHKEFDIAIMVKIMEVYTFMIHYIIYL